MKAVTIDGIVIPHIAKVDEIRDNRKFLYTMDDKTLKKDGFKYYQFVVWTDARGCHNIQGDSKKELEKRRKQLIADINKYYMGIS